MARIYKLQDASSRPPVQFLHRFYLEPWYGTFWEQNSEGKQPRGGVVGRALKTKKKIHAIFLAELCANCAPWLKTWDESVRILSSMGLCLVTYSLGLGIEHRNGRPAICVQSQAHSAAISTRLILLQTTWPNLRFPCATTTPGDGPSGKKNWAQLTVEADGQNGP